MLPEWAMLLSQPPPIKKSKERTAPGHARLLFMEQRSQAGRRFLPLLAGVSILLAGCGFEAPAPSRTPAPATPPIPVSTLSASLTVPSAQLARLLSNMTEYQIADLRNQ